MPKKASKPKKDLPLEQQLWKAADKLRKNMDAAEYKHVVLGLIFLKYISIAFEERHLQLKESQEKYGADPEDPDEYRSENVFFVPEKARWSYLQARAKLPTIGKDVDEAMDEIEKVNTSLKGVLPKVYAKENLDKQSLGGLIDLVSGITLNDPKTKGRDLLGHVYEYFLGQFALSEGKKGGQFYTPRYVVQLLVEMLEPYHGRVFDPCCGSGGMFIQSENFVTAHQGRRDDISILGQESNQTTWRLCKMNLAMHNIDSTNILWNNEGSFLNDAHKDLKADFILANPPFNDSDWSGELLKVDARWKYGIPPVSNANFAWIQHIIYHLSPHGTAGFIIADTTMTTLNSDESRIREEIIKAGLLDCIITLPSHLFANTQITVCLWFLARNKANGKFRNRKDEILFIDASKLGTIEKRKHRLLTVTDIDRISRTYHNWRNISSEYSDIPGFCKSAKTTEIELNNFILSPSRYISPVQQKINLNINLSEYIEFDKINSNINSNISSILNNWHSNNDIPLQHLYLLINLSDRLNNLSKTYYNGLIKKYFIDLNMNSNKALSDKFPSDWQKLSFNELFEERSTRVKEIGYCPPLYSVTNLGIQSREIKYTRDLSKSYSNCKVAFRGDMVFGLSREIPNLDVFTGNEGAFSSAYSIYKPYDIRIGLIVGALMRLNLSAQTDLLKRGAREGRGLDKERLSKKYFILPKLNVLDRLWGSIT